MKKVTKGAMGYRSYFKKKRLAGIAIMAAAIIVLMVLRTKASDTLSMLLTLSAVFIAIPLANYATPLAAAWKYPPTPEETHNKYQKYEKDFTVLYDMILTTKESIMPMDVIAVHPTGVYCLCTNPKAKVKKAEELLNQYFTAAKLDPNVHISLDQKTFDRRITTLKPASEYEDDGTIPYTVETLQSLCM